MEVGMMLKLLSLVYHIVTSSHLIISLGDFVSNNKHNMVACIWTLVDISFNLLMKATTLNCIVWYQCDLDLHSRSPLFESNLGSKSEQSHIECGAWFGICMLWCSFLDPIFCVCTFDLCIRCMCKAGGEDEPWLFHLHQQSLDYFYLLDSCSLLCFSKMLYGSAGKKI